MKSNHSATQQKKSFSKISIITVCYNSKKYIEQTITSVVTQTYNNIEYIIIDGGSTDGTLDIIKKYDAYIDRWISEPDDGIAHAMNKGIELATGDYILFLHSDDYLLSSDVLSETSHYLHSPFDIVMFDIFLEHNGLKKYRIPRGFNWWLNFKTGIFHQSALCSRTLFEKIGMFNTSLKIAMDYDFFLRAYKTGAKTLYINIPLAVMRLVGVSSLRQWPVLETRFNEERRIHFRHCSSLTMRIIYQLYWAIYLPYRKILFSIPHNGI